MGLDDQQATYWAGRATLCAGPDDLTRYDQVFEAWFDPRGELPRRRETGLPMPKPPSLPSLDEGGAGSEDVDGVLRAAATTADVLRHRDVASLDAAERQRLAAMFATLHPLHRCGVRRDTCAGIVAASTRPARCGTRCGGWGSRASWHGAGAGSARGGWCSWSTSAAR